MANWYKPNFNGRQARRHYDEHTYLITDTGRGVCKVGRSVNPASRLKQIQTGYPYPLTLTAVIPSSQLPEQDAHDKLAHLRLHGEWFSLTDEVVALFSGNLFVGPSQLTDGVPIGYVVISR